MSLISQSEFAKRAGVTRQAVQFAVKEGRISLTNGKIDTDNDMNFAYLQRANERRHGKKPKTNKQYIINKKDDVNLTEKLKAIKVQREKNKLLLEMGNYIPTSLVDNVFDELKKYFKESIEEINRKFDENTATALKIIIESVCKKVEEAMNELRK